MNKNIYEFTSENITFSPDAAIILPTSVMNLYVNSFEALPNPYTSINAGPNNVKIALSVNPKKIIEIMNMILLLARDENIFTPMSIKQ